MEFKCGSWKVMKKYVGLKVPNILGFFREENSKNLPRMKDDFQENGQI